MNITWHNCLGFVMWDYVSHERDSPWNLRFFVMVVYYELFDKQLKLPIATFFLGKGPSCSCLIMLRDYVTWYIGYVICYAQVGWYYKHVDFFLMQITWAKTISQKWSFVYRSTIAGSSNNNSKNKNVNIIKIWRQKKIE